MRGLTVFGRLKPGASAATARAELDGVVKRLAAAHPASNKELTVGVVETFNERFNAGNGPDGVPDADGRGRLRAADRLRQRRQPAAVALDGSGPARSRSATRWARPAGACCGSCWSRACCSPPPAGSSASASPSSARGCSIAPSPTSASRTGSSSPSTASSSPTWSAICVVTSLVFGLAPALQVARTSVGSVLKQGGRGSTGSRQMRGFSSALVVLELA